MADELADRVRRLEDLEEIRRLKARYCVLSDRGYDGAGNSPEGVAALFAEDGAWGDVRGRDNIRELFEGFGSSRPFSLHLAVERGIELDGERAGGRWGASILLVAAEGSSTWVVGVYDDAFVRTQEGWRFERLSFMLAAQVPAGPTVTMGSDR
jgi:hypothetical protein